ncbi:unnamed protein product [Brassicogethes aeneus]|uniref:Uncharacterized protein n=1 Tax=Brassicogethes aeneus TaxID=1431903 RepID=A0A9P0B3G3_BRAAE|nr:unnamed protein product [Brassicogethes aeneus]
MSKASAAAGTACRRSRACLCISSRRRRGRGRGRDPTGLAWVRLGDSEISSALTFESHCITSRRQLRRTSPRNSRRHVESPTTEDWETGLREATSQALNREGVSDPNLRGHVFAAPLVGKQENVVPFGDIIVLGRGQLYSTLEGLKFVQDPYQNDCDECHNKINRCGTHQCETWKHPNEQLVALWTAKKIRHREGRGHKYETEYIVSPIRADSSGEYMTKDGRFDYTMPGHVFVLKKTPPPFLDNSVYNNDASEHFPTLSQGLLPPISNNRGPVLFNYNPNGNTHTQNYPQQPIKRPVSRPPSTNDPKEIMLYKELLDSLASKTTTSNGPHRFELNGIPTASQEPNFAQHGTTFVPLQTTLIQLPTGQLVPATTLTQQQSFPTSTSQFPRQKYPTQSTQFIPSAIDTTYSQPPETTRYNPQQQTKPVTIHYYTPAVSEMEKPYSKPTTSVTKQPPTTYATTERYSTTTTHTLPEYSDDFMSSLFPETTGAQQKTTKVVTPFYGNIDQDFETSLFPETTIEHKPSKKPSKKYNKTKPTTVQFIEKTTTEKISTPSSDKTTKENLEEFPENFPTEPMKPITQTPLKKPYPDSINEQLPPPDDNTDTTIPYVSTAPTQKTTQAEAESTANLSKETTPNFSKETTQAYSTDSEPTSHITKITKNKPSRTSATKYTVPYTTVERTTQALNTLKVTTDESTVEESTTPLSDYYLPPKFDRETTKVHSTTLEEEQSTTEMYIQQSTYKEPTTGTIYYTKQPIQTTYGQRIPTTTGEITEYADTNGGTTPTTTPMTTLTYVGTTKPVRYTKRPTKKPTKHTDDFLVDGNQKVNKGSNKFDISNDDIFGSTRYVTQPMKTTKPYVQSDISKDLFGSQRNAKLMQDPDLVKPTPKIIYADFFEASTTETPQFDYENFGTTFYQPNPTSGLYETTHELNPQTSQSYSTSISFKVNKRNKTRETRHEEILYEPTIRAQISELDLGSAYRVYKAQLPVESTTRHTTTPDVKTQLDSLALQVLNHAKGIDYINQQKQPKYKRRFIPKRKNPPIKKKR